MGNAGEYEIRVAAVYTPRTTYVLQASTVRSTLKRVIGLYRPHTWEQSFMVTGGVRVNTTSRLLVVTLIGRSNVPLSSKGLQTLIDALVLFGREHPGLYAMTAPCLVGEVPGRPEPKHLLQPGPYTISIAHSLDGLYAMSPLCGVVELVLAN